MNDFLEDALTAEQRSALAANLLKAREEHSKRLAQGVALVIGSSHEFANDADLDLRAAVKNLVDGHHAFDEARPPAPPFQPTSPHPKPPLRA